MHHQGNPVIVILSGPIQSGKSSALLKWIEGKSVAGFITPILSGRKVMVNVLTAEVFVYELCEPKKGGVRVGNYYLCENAFDKAYDILQKAFASRKGWVVIDEIGKLELKGQGHHKALSVLFNGSENNMLLVIRESLLTEVIEKYKIKASAIITTSELNNYY